MRLDKATDLKLWEKYDVDGVGVFLVLDKDGEFTDEVDMTNLKPAAVVKSFTSTLTDLWDALKQFAKTITWQKDLATARAAAAKAGKPIAALFIPRGKDKKPDAKGATLLAWLGEIALARHYDRFIWVQIPWGKSRPPEATELRVTKAPALIALDPDGKRTVARPKLKTVATLAATLHKAATKIEAAQARKRRAQKQLKKRAGASGE